MPTNSQTAILFAAALAAAPIAAAQDNAPDQPDNNQQTDQQSPGFGVGDAVPPLSAPSELKWVMGERHTAWKPGDIYVLDFWATWCGPCIAAMPHIIELQEQYEDDNVHVIGVHVWASETAPTVDEFITNRSSEFNFNYDMVRETDDWAARTYMEATGSRGIPTIMIVNRQGKLAWIGHPMAMDEPLAQIVAGEYDMQEAIKNDAERRQKALEEQRIRQLLESPQGMEIQTALQSAYETEDYMAAVELFDRLVALDPQILSRFRVQQYNLAALELEDEDRAREIANAFLASPAAQRAPVLNDFAWNIVAPNSPFNGIGFRHTDLAVKAAKRAARITEHEDPDVLDTLARAQFVSGDIREALQTQRTAVDLLDDNYPASAVTDFEARLAEYEQAAANEAS